MAHDTDLHLIVPVAVDVYEAQSETELLGAVRDDLVAAANRRAAERSRVLDGDPVFRGVTEAPAGFESAEGLTWLAWECATASGDGAGA